MQIKLEKFGKVYKGCLMAFFVLAVVGSVMTYPPVLAAVIYLTFAILSFGGCAWFVGFMIHSMMDTHAGLIPLGLFLTGIFTLMAVAAGAAIIELVAAWFVLHELVLWVLGVCVAVGSVYCQYKSE